MIALTGATGFVGQTLLAEARRQGLDVRALTRRPQQPRPGVEWVQGDLSNRTALNRLVKGAEVVIHVAGVVNAPDKAGFEKGNVEGTLAMVEAAAKAGVPRFIFVSSLAAREPTLSAYGASKRRAEKVVAASGLDWTIVRPPAIYGPNDSEMFELFRSARWGVVPMPRDGRASIIHVMDLAKLLLALIPTGEDVTRCTFEPDDGQLRGWEHGDLARAIGAAVGRRVAVPRLSKAALSRVAKADGFFRKDKAKLTQDRVNYMCHPDWVSDAARTPPKDRWVPEIKAADGLKSTADWYRSKKWL